jgi:CubicO group peptidase (beta-lactamase class C family)
MESVDTGRVPGVVALIVDEKKVLYSCAFGKQNVAKDIDMREDSIFRIASMTKPITSVAVMQLVEQGKLGLNDPVSKYLPDLAKPEVFKRFDESGELVTKPAEGPTIRHLLTHTSGYGYGFCNHTLRRMQQKTGKAARDLPLLHEPGTRWTYGMGTRILGEVVEVASGQKLDEYLDAHVLVPLGMIDTSFTVPDDKLQRFVTLHQRTDVTLEEKPNPEPDRQAALGDGGLRSTANDYGKFLRMLLGEGSLGKTRVLSISSVEMMTSNQIGDLVVDLQPAAIPSFAQPFPLGAGRDKFGLGFQITVARDEEAHARSVGSYS